jgi:DNA-binding CsgD family transcriptional regulator
MPLIVSEPPCPGWDIAPPPKAPGDPCLSPVERELVVWLAEGRSNAEIAAMRCRSLATVRNQLHQLYRKLGVKTRGQAAAHWRSRHAASR